MKTEGGVINISEGEEDTKNASGSKSERINVDDDDQVKPEASKSQIEYAIKLEDVSVIWPLRKKQTVAIDKEGLLQLPDTENKSFQSFTPNMLYLVPVPEKVKPQFAILLAEHQYGVERSVAFLSNDANSKTAKDLARHLSISIQQPDPHIFASKDPHTFQRSNQNNAHLQCHYKRVPAHLFFFTESLLFGLKKPLLLLPYASFTQAVLQNATKHTFSLLIDCKDNEQYDDTTQYLFENIDISESAGVQAFIARLGIKTKAKIQKAGIYNIIKNSLKDKSGAVAISDEESEPEKGPNLDEEDEDSEEDDDFEVGKEDSCPEDYDSEYAGSGSEDGEEEEEEEEPNEDE